MIHIVSLFRLFSLLSYKQKRVSGHAIWSLPKKTARFRKIYTYWIKIAMIFELSVKIESRIRCQTLISLPLLL